MKAQIIAIILIFAGLLGGLPGLVGTDARAQSVQPMRFDLKPSGTEAQTTMSVHNNRAYPITVEMDAQAVVLDEAGREVLSAADDEFLIFPPQAIIQPGATQSVRVQYIGEPDIDVSKSYRVNVTQLAVDLSGEQRSGVAVAFSFATLAGVVPPGAKPQVSVRTLTPGEAGTVTAEVVNEGDAYARALGHEWRLSDGNTEHVLTSQEIAAMIDGVSGLIPPRAERRFTFVLPDGFDPAATRLTVARE